jgi:hypothetical protein
VILARKNKSVDAMTEYEQLRENNIARNQEFLRSLGLSDNNDLVKKEAKRQKKKRRHDDDFTESEEESRRRRLRTAPTRATLTRGAKEKVRNALPSVGANSNTPKPRFN